MAKNNLILMLFVVALVFYTQVHWVYSIQSTKIDSVSEGLNSKFDFNQFIEVKI